MTRSSAAQPDLLIVGAGPAGCAAAITALQRGCSVTLLEKNNRPRQQPGETLHPGVEPILRQLGVWESLSQCGFHRHEGFWRESLAGERVFQRYGQDDSGIWLGVQVDRLALTCLLRTRVTELGGAIIHIGRLELIRGTADLVVAADGIWYRAAVILDGTGRRSWLAKEFGLVAERVGRPQRLWFGWKQCAPRSLEDQPLFRERSDGWDWLCPLSSERCSWVKLRHASGGGGIDYTPRIHRDCAGSGYMLLGDAAFLLDPSSANGVLRALMTGIYAASLCAARCLGGHVSLCVEEQYRVWIARFFESSLSPAAPAARLSARPKIDALPSFVSAASVAD